MISPFFIQSAATSTISMPVNSIVDFGTGDGSSHAWDLMGKLVRFKRSIVEMAGFVSAQAATQVAVTIGSLLQAGIVMTAPEIA